MSDGIKAFIVTASEHCVDDPMQRDFYIEAPSAGAIVGTPAFPGDVPCGTLFSKMHPGWAVIGIRETKKRLSA
jgi:hypothetical protein